MNFKQFPTPAHIYLKELIIPSDSTVAKENVSTFNITPIPPPSVPKGEPEYDSDYNEVPTQGRRINLNLRYHISGFPGNPFCGNKR